MCGTLLKAPLDLRERCLDFIILTENEVSVQNCTNKWSKLHIPAACFQPERLRTQTSVSRYHRL
jgi:hypothetical protein